MSSQPRDASTTALLEDNQHLLEELARIYEEINWLYELPGRFEREIQSEAIFGETFAHVRSALPLARAEIWIPDEENNLYRCLVHFDGKRLAKKLETVRRTEGSDHLLQKIGTYVLRERRHVDSAEHLHLLALSSSLGLPVVALPLQTGNKLVGIVLFQIDSDADKLSSQQLRLFEAVGRHLSLCVHLHLLIKRLRKDEGLVKELSIAREIQQKLLPQSKPESTRFDIHAQCVTAAHVGGDYYDFFSGDDELGILVADASGHSIASGLIGVMFRSTFRHLKKHHSDLSELFEEVNSVVHDELDMSGQFLTAFYCAFNVETGRLRYVNAGHNPPLVYRGKTRECEPLTEAGIPFGVLGTYPYPQAETVLEPGDVLVCYTDGITEAENQHKEQFGEKRLEEAIVRYARQSATRMYHSMLMEMYMFQDERFNKDDVTIAVLKVK